MCHFRSLPHIFAVKLNATATYATRQTSLFDPILKCWREKIKSFFSLIAWSWFDWKSLRQSLLDGEGQEIDFPSFNRITIFLEFNGHIEQLKSRRDTEYFQFPPDFLFYGFSLFNYTLLFQHAQKCSHSWELSLFLFLNISLSRFSVIQLFSGKIHF